MGDEHAAYSGMKVGRTVEYPTNGMDIAAHLTRVADPWKS
jgi:hypothetical protein